MLLHLLYISLHATSKLEVNKLWLLGALLLHMHVCTCINTHTYHMLALRTPLGTYVHVHVFEGKV